MRVYTTLTLIEKTSFCFSCFSNCLVVSIFWQTKQSELDDFTYISDICMFIYYSKCTIFNHIYQSIKYPITCISDIQNFTIVLFVTNSIIDLQTMLSFEASKALYVLIFLDLASLRLESSVCFQTGYATPCSKTKCNENIWLSRLYCIWNTNR